MNELTANTRTLEIFPWNENFCTGIEEIDVQHKRLVELLNVLVSHLAFNADTPTLNNVFDELKNYTVVHFSTEERIWREHFKQDPWEAWHRDAHGDFIAKVLEIKQQESEMPMDDVIVEIVRFLTHWLALHIIESDKRMAKVVLALPSGISLQRAKDQANEEMAGSTRVLINTVMGMYDKLANRTVELTREISRRIKAEEELRRIQDQLLRLTNAAVHESQAKSTFLASMSHEIRTPINGMMGMAEMLANANLPAPHDHYARSVLGAGASLLAVVDDVLDFAKIQASQLSLREAPCEIRSWLDRVVQPYAALAERRGLEFVASVDTDLPQRLVLDEHRLAQSLGNLLSNALKFTEHGHLAVTLARQDATHWALRVTDSGIGIGAEDLRRIFEPFTQVDESSGRRYGGTGLGLSIVRQLTELMGGDVRCESRPHSGSSFIITLPLVAASDEVARSDADDPVGNLRGRVLVAEDNALNLEITRLFLESMGLSVVTAGDGTEAIMQQQATQPDLILMDCEMPGIDGLEATRRIRADARFRRVPIVALTAHALPEDRQACLDAGMDDYLSKPVDRLRLYRMLRQWLPQDA